MRLAKQGGENKNHRQKTACTDTCRDEATIRGPQIPMLRCGVLQGQQRVQDRKPLYSREGAWARLCQD